MDERKHTLSHVIDLTVNNIQAYCGLYHPLVALSFYPSIFPTVPDYWLL